MSAAGKRPIHTWILRCLIGSAAVLALSGCGINAIPTYEEQMKASLQSQLDGAEKRISAARRDYVEAVRLYNAELRIIPGRWWAALLYPDAELAQTFAVEEKDLNAPQVNFAPGTALVLESAVPVAQQ